MILTNEWQLVTLTANTSTTIQNTSGVSAKFAPLAVLPVDLTIGFTLFDGDDLYYNHTGVNLYMRSANGRDSVVYVEGETTMGETLTDPTIGEVTGTVTLTDTSGETADLYYTLNGVLPSLNNGILYTVPFTLTESATVKVRAFKTGFFESGVVTEDVVV